MTFISLLYFLVLDLKSVINGTHLKVTCWKNDTCDDLLIKNWDFWSSNVCWVNFSQEWSPRFLVFFVNQLTLDRRKNLNFLLKIYNCTSVQVDSNRFHSNVYHLVLITSDFMRSNNTRSYYMIKRGLIVPLIYLK